MEEEKNLNKKLKINKIIIVILLLILLISLIIILVKCVGAKNLKTNNDSNMGMVTAGDNYTFYYKYDNANRRISKNKGKRRV